MPEDQLFNKDFYDKMMEVHSSMKHLVEWSAEHSNDDNNRFVKVEQDIAWTKKHIYMGLGALAVVQIVIQFVK